MRRPRGTDESQACPGSSAVELEKAAFPVRFQLSPQPIIDNVHRGRSPARPLTRRVILRGPDRRPLRPLAERTLALPGQVPGAADTGIEQEPGQPQVRIAISRRAGRPASRHRRAGRAGRDRDRPSAGGADRHGVRGRTPLRYHRALRARGARPTSTRSAISSCRPATALACRCRKWLLHRGGRRRPPSLPAATTSGGITDANQ